MRCAAARHRAFVELRPVRDGGSIRLESVASAGIPNSALSLPTTCITRTRPRSTFDRRTGSARCSSAWSCSSGAAIAIYFALKPPMHVDGELRRAMPISALLFGLVGGAILSVLGMAIDWSWQGQRPTKKRPELA